VLTGTGATILRQGSKQEKLSRFAAKPLAYLSAVVLLPFLTSGNDKPTHYDQVVQRGSVTMLTRNGASSYFLDAEGATGPEYELVNGFADFLGVELEVHVADAYGQLSELLSEGKGDLIAANMTRTQSREEEFIFGADYAETLTEVVYRRGQLRPQSLEDLVGMKVAVIAGSSYEEMLKHAANDIDGLQWEAVPEVGMEDLLLAISEGEIDATLVDSNILGINKQFYPSVNRAFTLDETQAQAWAFRKNGDESLAEKARQFISQADEDGSLAVLQDRYFNRETKLDQVGMFHFLKQVRNRLPVLLPVFQEVAELHDVDWRLLAAMGYQESHWDPLAESTTGVRGIMMLTLNTANQLGLSDRLDPHQSIEGGARYFLRLWHRTPFRIPEPDRTWMALAAYNIGWGHLEDARILTQRQGGNPDNWKDVSERLPLLMQEKWHKQTKYGYARGLEAQRYVRNIRNYFDILMWMDTRSHPLLVADTWSPTLGEIAP
jgi:membrane-bound lytic murein transglycosylase F